MKKALSVVGLAVMIGVVSVAMAGDKQPCTADTQECLNKMIAKIQAKGWLGVETEQLENGRWEVTRCTPTARPLRQDSRPGTFLSPWMGST